MRPITAEKKTTKYEVVEANDETDVPFSSRPSQKFAGYLPGYGPKYGIYISIQIYYIQGIPFFRKKK